MFKQIRRHQKKVCTWLTPTLFYYLNRRKNHVYKSQKARKINVFWLKKPLKKRGKNRSFTKVLFSDFSRYSDILELPDFSRYSDFNMVFIAVWHSFYYYFTRYLILFNVVFNAIICSFKYYMQNFFMENKTFLYGIRNLTLL